MHENPDRGPEIHPLFKDDEEYNVIPEAFYYGFMDKNRPNDYTAYIKAAKAYNIMKYKKEMQPFLAELDKQIKVTGNRELKQYRDDFKALY